MGASQSTTSVNVVNQSIIDAVIQNVNNCSATSTQSQQVTFSGLGLFSSASQTATLNLQCLQNVKVNNDLITSMAQKIIQDAQSQAVALMPSYSGSNAQTSLSNYLQTKITNSTIQNCANNAVQTQNITFTGVQIGSSSSQTLSLFSECMQKALNNNQVAQNIVQDTSQTVSSKTSNPLDFLSQYAAYVVIGIIAFIILIIVIGYMIFGRGSPAPVAMQQPPYMMSPYAMPQQPPMEMQPPVMTQIPPVAMQPPVVTQPSVTISQPVMTQLPPVVTQLPQPIIVQ